MYRPVGITIELNRSCGLLVQLEHLRTVGTYMALYNVSMAVVVYNSVVFDWSVHMSAWDASHSLNGMLAN